MLTLYINATDRTADLQRNTLKKTNQLQQRADTLDFTLFQGTQPSSNQDVKLYMGDTVSSIVGATITLNGYYEKNVRKFFTGQVLWIRVGETNAKKVTVLTYDETTLQLVLTASPGITVNPGDKIAWLAYGGLISKPKNVNVEELANLEYPTECIDYSKIFDKKLIADTWANVDTRYIINDFVNSTVNYNQVVDNLSYVNNTAIQAEWLESSDGGNPTVDTSDFMEATSAGVFPWTFSGGTARWEATPISINVSAFTGVNSSTPTAGSLMAWIEASDFTKITSIKLRVGSDSSNYAEVTLDNPTANTWQYRAANLNLATIVGTPDWTAMDYVAISIVQTASASIKINGIRINSSGSFTCYNVSPTTTFANFKSANLKPTALMQLLAKNFQYVWYIDYERDIHFVPSSTSMAPYSLGDSTLNFANLEITVDQSNLANRVIVQGGEGDSVSTYAQVIPGDNAVREWILKNRFKNLTVKIDDNTSTHAAVAGTTATNIKIVAHGLSTGDHIINRTRSNAVRAIAVVDPDNFTVETVTSQTSGDTITFFAVSKTVGIEGIDIEANFDYLSNYERQSIRASSQTATLPVTSFIRFSYTEKIPIEVQYTDPTSANALKALGLGDGIIDATPVTDRSIQDVTTAIVLAQAKIADYKNPVITGSFDTDKHGLEAGQIIVIQDSVRGINTSYMIQVVKMRQSEGEYGDYMTYSITFGTTLFGVIEFYQKLLATQGQIEDNADEVVQTFVSGIEEVSSHAAELAQKGGFKSATVAEEVSAHADEHTYKHNYGQANTWHYETSVGQDLLSRYDLCDYAT